MNTRLPDEVDILNAALEKSGAARGAYLDAATLANPSLRAKIEALLMRAERGPDLLDNLTLKSFATQPCDPIVNSRIHRYKVLKRIGEGGCGVVYLAEQQELFRRRVALKIIKAGMDTKNVVARFEAERQALALMEHPNIAKVFDAGSTDTGRPYFVMEFVEGKKITDYCTVHQLSIDDRLHLFLQVCDAVQHAHQKGIIHRDLKPSNILVCAEAALDCGSPLPLSEGHGMRTPTETARRLARSKISATSKVIDFGIAKVIQGKLTDETIHTPQHQFLGTPAYMSPEQADLSPDIDTRTDTYSLGVLLYELLTGRPPFDNHELLTAGLNEMRRIIREVEPKRPSSLSLTTNYLFPSDLDWIVLKCLEKDRSRRYETVNSLAEDIRRHLNCKPILAHPPSFVYRLSRFTARNRVAVAASAAVFLALLGGVVASSWQAVRARRAEANQARQRLIAERRLAAALRFVDHAFYNIAPTLQNTIGAAAANRLLAEGGMKLLDELRVDLGTNQAFAFALGQLHLEIALAQGWFAGNTSGSFDASLESAKRAISLLSAVPPARTNAQQLHQLARAEMVAGYAAVGLRRYDDAIQHFGSMRHWAERHANGEPFADAGRFRAWAFGSTGYALLVGGHVSEALTNYLAPLHSGLLERKAWEKSAERYDLHDIQRSHNGLGLAHKRLYKLEEALFHLQESLRLALLAASKYPNKADVATFLIEAYAELGELHFLRLEIDQGRELLTKGLELSEALVGRDRANFSFARNRINVLRLAATGWIAASERASATPQEQQLRLEQANVSLLAAEKHLSDLPKSAGRTSLEAEIEFARYRWNAARERISTTPTP